MFLKYIPFLWVITIKDWWRAIHLSRYPSVSMYIIQVLYIYLSMSTKILLVHSNWKINKVLRNYYFYWYCNSNIGLYSIASCKVITLNLIFLIFWIRSFLHFSCYIYCFRNLVRRVIDICRVAIEKRSYTPKIILPFGCSTIIFAILK